MSWWELCPKWWVICLSNKVFSAECTKPLPTYQLIQWFSGSPMRRLPEEAEEDDAAGVRTCHGCVMGGTWMLMNHWFFLGGRIFPKRWTMRILNQNFVKLHPFSSQKSQPCFSGEARKQVWRADNVPLEPNKMVMLVSISSVVPKWIHTWQFCRSFETKCHLSKFQLPTVVHTNYICVW